MITSEILKKIATSLSTERATVIADVINNVCPAYGITKPNILHEFLATIIHESGEFSIKEENLSYSAKRITEVWPSRFPILAAAVPYTKNPQKLANKVYGGRMGNDTINDGWTYRGRGAIQITGKESYATYFTFKKNDGGYHFNEMPKTLEELTELMLRDDWGIDAACWEFAINKRLIQAALNNDFKTVTKRINGGVIGYEDRIKYYERCKKYLI